MSLPHFNPNTADVSNVRGVLMNALRTSAALDQERAYSTITHVLAIAQDVYEIRLHEIERIVASSATNAIQVFQYITRALESIRNERWELPKNELVPTKSYDTYQLTRLTILLCNIVAQDIPVIGLYKRHEEMVPLMDRYFILRANLVRLNAEFDELEQKTDGDEGDEDAMEEVRPFIAPIYDAVEQMRLHLTRKLGFVGVEVQGAAF